MKGSVLGQLLFLLYTSEVFSIQENKLISYVDVYDCTLFTVVPSSGDRATVAEFLNRDLGKDMKRCDI